MKRIVFLIFVVCAALQMFAQEEPQFGITFSGFVKNDFFFDSRQTIAAREGHFLLWPAAESLDVNDIDMNAKANFNFLAIQSRLSGKISGPEAFGAKTSALMEVDFFAQANDNINLVRMRHALIKFNWENTELLTGQYWNPFFVTACFPGTVSFNTGTPLQSFARNPQIRLTQSVGNLKIMIAALAQRDFASRGISGPTSTYLRNSAMPDMHLQVHYATENLIAGAGGAYKSIVPRLSSLGSDFISTYKVDERVPGLSALAFAKLTLDPVTIKVQGRYGENIPDVLSISGFAVKDTVDATTLELEYTPLSNITFWGDIHTNGKTIQAGIFGGILLNNGTKDAMADAVNPVVYGLGTNIRSLLRVSPRLIYNSGKARFAAELEYTSAAYGSNYDENYVPDKTTSVSNVRFLVSAYYFF